MIEKSHRNLAQLEQSGSSARVLSLLGVHRRHGAEPQHRDEPFFRDPLLNRAIILKHRLRRDEQDLFADGRLTTTKIILPLDSRDLRLGGRSVLVGQIGYEAIMAGVFGTRWVAEDNDRQLLELIDRVLSLDPFLLREHLRRHGRRPARLYFDLSAADYARMHRFVERDIGRFISGGVADADRQALQGTNLAAETDLAKRLLTNAVDLDADPLRQTLQMDRFDFAEGIFCWKGFLYYKWTLLDLLPRARTIARSIAAMRPAGAATPEMMGQLETARRSLARAVLMACEAARTSLKAYDAAFAQLVNGQPKPFRDFLGAAPELFTDLGQRLGGVGHVVSFWSFRFPKGAVADASAEELLEIFADFEDALVQPVPLRLSA